MIILPFILGQAFPLFLGYAALRALDFPLRDRTLVVSLSYCLGQGLLGSWMFALAAFAVPLSLGTIALPLAVLAGCLVLRKPSDQPAEAPPVLPAAALRTWGEIICWAYILYVIIFILWRAANIPVYSWDAIATSTFKAKIFFFEERFTAFDRLPHPQYPLLLPLLQTWIAITIQKWSDQAVNIVIPLFFVSYLGVHYAVFHSLAGRFWAAAGTALLATANFCVAFATVPYRETVLMAYICSSALLILLGLKDRKESYLWVAGVLCGLAVQTKLEGIGYGVVLAALLMIFLGKDPQLTFGKKIRRIAFFALPGLLATAGFLGFKLFYQVPSSGRFRFLWDQDIISRATQTAGALFKVLFLSGNWNILWFVLGICLATGKLNDLPKRWTAAALGAFFLMYAAVSIFTPNFISLGGKESVDVLPRVILHFYPLAAFLIVLFLKERD